MGKEKLLSTKQIIILCAMALGLIGIWAILAFLSQEELVPRLSLWANFVFGTGSLITAILALTISILSFRKSEALRRQKIVDEANLFINENNNELLYIPFCLIANAYDNHHKFHRKIYNSFNVLNKELQQEVLKQLNYDYSLIENNKWINKGIDLVKSFVEDNDLGKDYLYDGAKYFHRAINYADQEFDPRFELGHVMPDNFSWNPKLRFEGDQVYQENISFDDYFESYLRAKKANDPKYFLRKNQKPITLLAEIFDFGKCEEEFLCCWMMQIVETVAIHISCEKEREKNLEIELLSKGDAEIQTIEDKYLHALMELYNLHLVMKAGSNEKYGTNREVSKKGNKTT